MVTKGPGNPLITEEDIVRGGVRVPRMVTFDSIQSALDSAKGTSEKVLVAGEITTDQTLNIACNCEMSELTVNYTGSGIAVRVGVEKDNSITRHRAELPRVVNQGKSGKGWSSVAGSIGVQLYNLYTWEVFVPFVNKFEVGLDMVGEGAGLSYVSTRIGQLSDNKINQRLRGETGGWVNENLFIGGRFSHSSNEAEGGSKPDMTGPAPGTRHIQLIGNSEHTGPNNNLWVKPSIETPGTCEYQIETINGHTNRWIQGRFENSFRDPRVRHSGSTPYNVIDGGMWTERVQQDGDGSTFDIHGVYREQKKVSSSRGTILENGFSTNAPVFSFFAAANGVGQSREVHDSEWLLRIGAGHTAWKSASNAFPRVKADSRGYLEFGNGSSEPSARLTGNYNSLCLSKGDALLPTRTEEPQNLGNSGHMWADTYTRRLSLDGISLEVIDGLLKASTGGTTWQPVVLGDDARLSDARTPKAHRHDWDEIDGVPTEFPPTAHPISKVTNLQAELDGKEKKPWQGTQAQYNALGSYESDRTYYITD